MSSEHEHIVGESQPVPRQSRGERRRAASDTGGTFGGGVGKTHSAYPEAVNRLIEELARLPGIGRRSAERLAFHLLKTPEAGALALARAIEDVKARVRHCRVCYNLADGGPAESPAASRGDGLCVICANPERDHGVVMVVEQPKDLISLELTGAYRGVYHVLMGRISPLDGIGPGDITIGDLIERVAHPESNVDSPVREVVLALNPTLEGDGTALYLIAALKRAGTGVHVTRIARGVPAGSTLELASKAVLADAIESRRPML